MIELFGPPSSWKCTVHRLEALPMFGVSKSFFFPAPISAICWSAFLPCSFTFCSWDQVKSPEDQAYILNKCPAVWEPFVWCSWIWQCHLFSDVPPTGIYSPLIPLGSFSVSPLHLLPCSSRQYTFLVCSNCTNVMHLGIKRRSDPLLHSHSCLQALLSSLRFQTPTHNPCLS